MRYHLFAGRLHLLIIPIHTDRYGLQWVREANTIIYSVLWENYFILTRFVEMLRTVAQWKISGVYIAPVFRVGVWMILSIFIFFIFYIKA